jgi:hypothetical protein
MHEAETDILWWFLLLRILHILIYTEVTGTSLAWKNNSQKTGESILMRQVRSHASSIVEMDAYDVITSLYLYLSYFLVE